MQKLAHTLTLAAFAALAAGCARQATAATAPRSAAFLDRPCAAGPQLAVDNRSAEWIRVYGRRAGDPTTANGTGTLATVAPHSFQAVPAGSDTELRRIETQSIDRPTNPDASPRTPAGVSLSCTNGG